jgi:CheY-like chemotaxis protein
MPSSPVVLIVEDDPDTREMLGAVLSLSGYETVAAEHGAAALARMRQRLPCLVLLDLMMPVMDGWEFRAHQLGDRDLAAVPVVAVSAICGQSDRVRNLNIPCVKKPVDVAALLMHVADACGPPSADRRS